MSAHSRESWIGILVIDYPSYSTGHPNQCAQPAQRRTPPTFMVSVLRVASGFGSASSSSSSRRDGGFHFLEGISWLVLLLPVSVLTTLGLPIIPQHRSTELFTALFAIGGIGFFLYAIGFMAQTIFSREFQRMLVRRKALQRMKELRKHYIICGFGRIGEKVARDLGTRATSSSLRRRTVWRYELDGLNVVRGDASAIRSSFRPAPTRPRLDRRAGSDAENCSSP